MTRWFRASRSGSGRRAFLHGGSSLSGGLPIPWEKFVDPLGGIVRQFGEDEGEPGLRIDLIEFASLDQRIDASGSSTTFVRSGERPISSAYGHAA